MLARHLGALPGLNAHKHGKPWGAVTAICNLIKLNVSWHKLIPLCRCLTSSTCFDRSDNKCPSNGRCHTVSWPCDCQADTYMCVCMYVYQGGTPPFSYWFFIKFMKKVSNSPDHFHINGVFGDLLFYNESFGMNTKTGIFGDLLLYNIYTYIYTHIYAHGQYFIEYMFFLTLWILNCLLLSTWCASVMPLTASNVDSIKPPEKPV